MKIYRFFLLSAIFLLQLFAMPTKVNAGVGSAAGGEIIYQYINDSTYRFYYHYQRKCSGIPEPNMVSLCYRNTCTFIWQTSFMYRSDFGPFNTVTGQEVVKGCPGMPTSCTSLSATTDMYRDWWYTSVVTITEPCNKWIFSVNMDERDRDSLTNLVILPPFEHDLYTEATLDNLNAPHQSSPYFSSPVPVFACANAPFQYNNGVMDPDGDSLVYKIIQPRSAYTDLFVICAGYPPYNMAFAGPQYNTINNPLLTNNTFTLNQNTGNFSFTPLPNQVAYLAYLVEKYRNGQLIGSTMRDARIEIRNANTLFQPQLSLNPSTITGGVLSNDTIIVCGNNNLNFCFNLQSSGATVVAAYDNSNIVLENATVTYQNQGSNNVTGCVTWTPAGNDTGFKNLIVFAKDSTCTPGSYPVVQAFSIPVIVKAGTQIQASDTLICPGASTTLSATGGSPYTWSVTSSSPPSGFSCIVCDTTIVTPSDTTYYILTSSISNGCPSKDTICVAIDRFNILTANPDTIVLCNGGEYVQLQANTSGPQPLKIIDCGTNGTINSGVIDSFDYAQQSGNSNLVDWHGQGIYWGPFYSYFRTQKMQVLYRKEELKGSGIEPGSIRKIALNYGSFSGINPAFQNVKIALRCTDKFEFVAPFQNEFETGLTEVFTATSVTIHPGWNEFSFNIPYDYDTAKNLVVQFCYSGVNPVSPYINSNMLPIYYISNTYKSTISAGQQGTGNSCVNNLGAVVTSIRKPDTRFFLSPPPVTNFDYTWTPTTGLDNPLSANTGLQADHTDWYTVSTHSKYGCILKDSILVYVADNNFTVNPQHTDICIGDVITLEASGGAYYNWSDELFQAPQGFSCVTCPDPTVTAPLGLNPYKLIAADDYGCSDTLDVSINVNPIPATNILNNDTSINYGESIQLFAEGANFYFWTPEHTINNPRLSNPIVSPLESTLYIVNGYAPGGCVVKDSVWVRVNLHEKVLIPSAFSPNGDGLNDVFKIENLKFQKVYAFTIHDRWGNEIYKAPLNQNGWNGTYNGNPMPVGTYFYSIQLHFPDGMIETYKGDVTLIR
jgi:gliding motility-associated-like protein